MKRSMLQVAKDNAENNDIYEFIIETYRLSCNYRKEILGMEEPSIESKNVFYSLIIDNSFAEVAVLEYINSKYPIKINMKARFEVAYRGIYVIRHELVECYSHPTSDLNIHIENCIRWLESIIGFCRTEHLYGAQAQYLHFYGKLLNILCGEDIY